MCGVSSSLCRCAATMFSLPNRSAKYLILSVHHSSSLPSFSMRSMSSCVPDTLIRIARTWLFPILRVSPASSNRLWMAAERSFIPSGYVMSFRLRCVLVGSAFFGMMKRSMWAVVPLSEPCAFSMCNTTNPIYDFPLLFACLTSFDYYFYTAVAVGFGESREVQPLWLIGEFSALPCNAARTNSLISYGIFR